jgi:hypothetical protein
LQGLLAQHLQGNIVVDTAPLRDHVARFDWTNQVAEYDKRLEDLVR